MKHYTRCVEKVPEWAICYIVNGDATGITDEEKKAIDDFIDKNNAIIYPPNDDEPYFAHYPLFNSLPCNVYDCYVDYEIEDDTDDRG
jgi:hypothetical protein